MTSSVAYLLDDVRPLIAAARARGEKPRYILLSSADYDAVASVKAPDVAKRMPMMILGLEIVRSDDVAQRPKVF